MNNRKPPSKPVLVAAVLPIPVAIACMLGFGHFGISLGVIISIISLVAYYIIFGIIYVVLTYKHDKVQQEIDKAASPALKAATIFLMIFTAALIGGAFTAFALDKKTIGLICVGSWVALILLFILAMACSSRVRKTPPKSANRRGEGVCEHCVPCMGVSYMSGIGKDGVKYNSKSTYKIIVDLDGRKLTAYSHSRYCCGDVLQIAYSDNGKKCYIL